MQQQDYGIQLLDDRSSQSSSFSSSSQQQLQSFNNSTSSSSSSSSKINDKSLTRTSRQQRLRGVSGHSAFDEVTEDDYSHFYFDFNPSSYEYEDPEDAAFVLQYSTLNGRRLKKDEIIYDFAMGEVMKDNPVLRWTKNTTSTSSSEKKKDLLQHQHHKFYWFSPKVTRILTVTLLLFIFFLPPIWNVLVAFFSYDSIVRQQEVSIAARSTTSLVGSLYNLNAREILVEKKSLCFNFSIADNSSISDAVSQSSFSSALPIVSSTLDVLGDNISEMTESLPFSFPSCFDKNTNFTSSLLQNSTDAFNSIYSSIENRSLILEMPEAVIWKSVFPRGSSPSSNQNQNQNQQKMSFSSILKNDRDQTVSERIVEAAKLSWNPYAFAIFCNLVFSFLCIVTYHRVELRRRVSALFLSYGAICVNRWSGKRVIALTVFSISGFFACFSTFSVVFGWRYLDPTSAGGEDEFEAEYTVRFNRTKIPMVNSSSLASSPFFFTSNFANSNTSLSFNDVEFSIDDDFFWLQHPRIVETLRVLKTEGQIFDDYFDSASSSSSSSSSSTSGDRLESSSPTASVREFSASFMFFFSSFFGALLPYFFPLAMIWSKWTTPTILESILFNTRQNTTSIQELSFSLSMISYITGGGGENNNNQNDLATTKRGNGHLKFKCDLDILLRAIRMISAVFPRSPNDEEEEDHRKDTTLEEDYVGQGFIISTSFSLNHVAGWSTPWRARRTNEEHPHELLFGTTWGKNEEEVNAVLSVMFEHGCLGFLSNELADDIHWNKPEITRDEINESNNHKTNNESFDDDDDHRSSTTQNQSNSSRRSSEISFPVNHYQQQPLSTSASRELAYEDNEAEEEEHQDSEQFHQHFQRFGGHEEEYGDDGEDYPEEADDEADHEINL